MIVPIAVLCAALTAVLYLLTAAPGLYWLDSSELVASAWSLGIAHPPGHPLASLLARLTAYLPVGTIAFRVSLASALETAAAVGVTALISHQLVLRLGQTAGPADDAPPAPPAEQPRIVRLCIGITSITVGCSYALWFQAIRAEVYALNLVLLLTATYLLLRWDDQGDRRHLLIAGLVIGLALCNHHLLVLLALPAGALFVLSAQRRLLQPRRMMVGLVGTTLLGLGTLVYLPLRAARLPLANWGAPHALDRFIWVVSAQAFQKSVDRAADESLGRRSLGAIYAVMGGPPTDLGPMIVGAVVALLGFAGLYLCVRRRATRRAGLLLGAMAALNIVGPVLVGFDPFNPDAHGYLALAVALLGPGMAVMLVTLVQSARKAGRPRIATAIAGTGVLLLLFQLGMNLPRNDLRDHWATDMTAHELLDQPPGALLLTSHFQSLFASWAMQTSRDARPDLAVVHRNFIRQPGYMQTSAERLPTLRPQLMAWARSKHIARDDLDGLATKRAVAVEHDLNVPSELAAQLLPSGLTLAYIPSSVRPPDRVAMGQALRQHIRQIIRWRREIGPIEHSETRRAVIWIHYVLARFACARGLEPMARLHLDLAHRLGPQAVDLHQLRHGCLPGG